MPSYMMGAPRRIDPDSRPKEGPRIALPDLPQPIGYRAWMSAAVMEIVAVANRDDPDEVGRWVEKVFQQGMTLERLDDSQGFGTLDIKLAAAVMRIAKGELSSQISLEAERYKNRKGKVLKGRQCLFLVNEQYRMDENCGALFNISDLISVQWLGDGKMAEFLARWDHILVGMTSEPPESIKEQLFLDRVWESSALKYEVAH